MIKVNRALRIGSRINNSTSGEIIFTDALGKLNQDSAFFWDNVNKRLGIGKIPTSHTLDLSQNEDDSGILVRGFDDQSQANLGLSITSTGFAKMFSNRNLQVQARDDITLKSTEGNIIFAIPSGKQAKWLDSSFETFMTADETTGNVGIGTDSPSSTIHLYEDNDKTGTDAGLTIEQDGTGDAVLQFLLTAEKRWVIGIDHNDENKFKITKDGNLSTNGFLTIDDDGNVGIGTTNPDEKLTIDNGTLLFQNDGGLCFGEIYSQDNTTETAITTAGKVNKVQITIFNTNGHSNNTSPDHTNDHITITKAGKYMVNISLSVESIAGDSDKLGFSLYKNNGTTEFPNIHFHRDFTSGAAKTGSASMNGIIDCAVNDTIELWGWNENDTDNFLIEDVTISLFQIGG